MEYEIIKPTCIGCEKEVDSPSDVDMELFRLGLPLHIECARIFDNVEKVIREFRR